MKHLYDQLMDEDGISIVLNLDLKNPIEIGDFVATFAGCWHVNRVNHSECYSDHGKHTNMAESYFSRLRRMVDGQHHGVSPKHLHQYANHAAWLEDNRRTDNGTLASIVVSNAMGAKVSRDWNGYWQRA